MKKVSLSLIGGVLAGLIFTIFAYEKLGVKWMLPQGASFKSSRDPLTFSLDNGKNSSENVSFHYQESDDDFPNITVFGAMAKHSIVLFASARDGNLIALSNGLRLHDNDNDGMPEFASHPDWNGAEKTIALYITENGHPVSLLKDETFAEEYNEYKIKAELGDAVSQNALGDCYYNGEGVAKDYEQAVKWYRKAAEQGYAMAQNNLGYCYITGYVIREGVANDEDYVEGVKWFKKAAAQGLAESQCLLGSCYAYGKGVAQDQEQALKLYRKSAAQGYAEGQHALGRSYSKGEGVAQNHEQAVKWYRKAAEQGLARAQNELGVCYVKGEGVAKDLEEAVKWYRRAAEQGFPDAQYNLGVCYAKGEGIAKDQEEAVKWYRKAAAQGCEDAIKVLKSESE